MMNPIASLIAVALLGLTAGSALAGEGGSGVGNGGAAWTCRGNGPGRPLIWVELLDLSEARREFNLTIARDTPFDREDWIRMVERKLAQASPDWAAAFHERLQQTRDAFTLVKASEFLSTGDFYDRTRPGPETCPGGTVPAEPEQLANFTHQGHLIVNDALWSSSALSEADRAALYVHEAVYKLLRETENASNSVKSREIVGYLFSNAPISQYSHLLKLAKPGVMHRAIDLAQFVGNYESTSGDWADIAINHFDPRTQQLFLSEQDRDEGGREVASHVFKCKPEGQAFRCEMSSTTNRFTRFWRGVCKHKLLITEENGFVWLNQRPSRTIRATRYIRREP
jgi:hypothetical protein